MPVGLALGGVAVLIATAVLGAAVHRSSAGSRLIYATCLGEWVRN